MTVLAAIDVDRAPERPIAVGYDLASAYDDTLVVVYTLPEDAFHEQRESRDQLPDEFRDEEFTVERATDLAGRRATNAVEDTLGEYDRRRVEPRGRVGSPADEVLDAADELDPGFVVVGGRKRSPAKQAIFGSVSQEIVREADQPVVTITTETG